MKVGDYLEENLLIDYKRMLQRRGNKSDIGNLSHGELGLAEDEAEFYFGFNGEEIKILSDNSLEDSLTSTDNKKALTANRGRELDNKIKELQNYIDMYLTDIVNVVDRKQETLVYKNSSAPNDTELIWLKTV